MKFRILLMFLVITKCSVYAQINNLSSASLLSNDTALSNAISTEASNRGISLTHAQLAQARVGSYSNAPFQSVVLVDSANPTDIYFAYFDQGLYSFLRLTTTSLGGGITSYRYESLNGQNLYYSFNLNSTNHIGGLDFGEDLVGQELRMAPDYNKTCPQQFPSDFKKCMNCAVSECYSEWLCALMCTAGGLTTFLLCSAGWGIACSGVVQ